MQTAFLMVFVTLGGSPGQGPLPTPDALVQAVGIGFPPPRMHGTQRRLMAQRAAEVAAVRNLAVKLGIGPQGRLPTFRYVSTTHLLNRSVEVMVETTVPVGGTPTATPTTKTGIRPRRQVGGKP